MEILTFNDGKNSHVSVFVLPSSAEYRLFLVLVTYHTIFHKNLLNLNGRVFIINFSIIIYVHTGKTNTYGGSFWNIINHYNTDLIILILPYRLIK